MQPEISTPVKRVLIFLGELSLEQKTSRGTCLPCGLGVFSSSFFFFFLYVSIVLLFCRLFVLLFFSLCYSLSHGLVVLCRAVRQTVPSQVTVAPKHLSAAATAVGLDVCMGEKVSFQVTSLIKGSSACGAFVGGLLFRFKASKKDYSL